MAGGGDQEGLPYMQLFFLVLCRIAEPVALASAMPYAYDMLKSLLGGDGKDAAFYAGIFVASFSFAEFLTGVLWGWLSDTIGRKPVLLIGCAGTLIALLMIGFSTSVWMAILGRSLCGFLNGNVGVVQTMVGELVTDPKHEVRAFAIMPFFWSIGLTLGPTIGGTFAQPVKAFPSVFHEDSIFATFPYLLPNLICASMLLITVIVVLFFLEETHPKMRRKDRSGDDNTSAAESGLHDPEAEPLMPTTSNNSNHNSYRSFPTPPAEVSGKGRIPFNVWMLLFAISIKMAHSVTFQQLLPIFLRTPHDDDVPVYYLGGVGGLSLSLQAVGLVMAVNGIASVGVQALIYPVATASLGAGRTLRLASTLHPFAYILLPYIAFIQAGTWRFTGIFVWLVIRCCFNMLTPPLMYIFLKRSTPNSLMLGRINGLATSMGAGMKTLSPLAAGYLQQVGEKHHISALAWWGSGFLAAVGAAQCWFLETPE